MFMAKCLKIRELRVGLTGAENGQFGGFKNLLYLCTRFRSKWAIF